MKQTKHHILEATLSLFNERGFVNVRLQHIADQANVSIGNLAYHYATKKDLLGNIYEQLVKKQVELLNELNIVPLFESLDRHWDNVFETQTEFAFFYQDTLEVLRFDDQIAKKYRKHIEWEQDQYQRVIQFNCARGAFEALANEEEVKQKSELIWLMENSWLQLALISGKEAPGAQEFKSYMWQSITPYLSPIGKQEYEQLIRYKQIPL
ncbi:MAG: TetR/AcrR family transcriptional regulator [Cyclobacteriaceae bacterium]